MKQCVHVLEQAIAVKIQGLHHPDENPPGHHQETSDMVDHSKLLIITEAETLTFYINIIDIPTSVPLFCEYL